MRQDASRWVGRRALLSGLAAGLAGCSLPAGEPTETTTGTPTATPEPTPRPGSVPSERVYRDEAVTEGGIAVGAEWWMGFEELRYRTAEGETATVPLGEEWVVAYTFTLRNAGDRPHYPLVDSQFRLRVAGRTHEHVHELPGGVSFDSLEQEGEPRIRELAWYDRLVPGESAELQLVFVVPPRPEYRHYLVWDHGTTIDGREASVYLLGERRGAPADFSFRRSQREG